jgi:lipopolysaccharide export system permease protein
MSTRSLWSFFGISVLDRYLMKQLVMPFLFGIGAFSSIGVSAGALFDLIRQMAEFSLPLAVVGKVLMFKLPLFISYAMPMATLLAALMMYSRLSTDSELIAMRSSGISSYRLAIPAIVMSLLVTAMSFTFNESIVPSANFQAKAILESFTTKDGVKQLKERDIVTTEYSQVPQPDGSKQRQLSRLFYASELNGGKLSGLTVLDFSKAGLTQIIAAQSATWDQTNSIWDFSNGTVYAIAPDGSYKNIFKFEQQKITNIPQPRAISKGKEDWMEMNLFDLREALDLAGQTGDDKRMMKFRQRIQQKFAWPFVCLVFGLTGAATGMQANRRSGKGTSFALCIVIVFAYYTLAFTFDQFGIQGLLPPIIAAWLAIVIFLSVGTFLLRRASQ